MAITLSPLSPRPSPGGGALAAGLVLARVVVDEVWAVLVVVVRPAPVRATFFFDDEPEQAPRRQATTTITPTRRSTGTSMLAAPHGPCCRPAALGCQRRLPIARLAGVRRRPRSRRGRAGPAGRALRPA